MLKIRKPGYKNKTERRQKRDTQLFSRNVIQTQHVHYCYIKLLVRIEISKRKQTCVIQKHKYIHYIKSQNCLYIQNSAIIFSCKLREFSLSSKILNSFMKFFTFYYIHVFHVSPVKSAIQQSGCLTLYIRFEDFRITLVSLKQPLRY